MNIATKQNFKSIAPVLNVNTRTMKPTIDLFVEQLGFEIDTVLGKQPAFAMLKRDDLVIMLVCKPAIPWTLSHMKVVIYGAS